MRVSAVIGRGRALISRHSLRANLVLLLIAVVTILVIDRTYELTRVRNTQIREAEKELSDLAAHGAERQANVVASARALLSLAVDLPISGRDSRQNCQEPFAAIVADLPWLRSLWLTTPDGRAICTNSEKPVTFGIGDRPSFKSALARRAFTVSDLIIGRVSGKPGIIASMPRIRDGRIETVVSAMIEVDWLSKITSEIGASHEVEALLIDGAGTIVAAYPDSEKWVGHSLRGPDALAGLIKAPSGVIRTTSFDGTPRIVSHAQLHESNAVFAVMRSLDSVVGGANRLARYELAKILIAGAVSFLVIWLGGQRLVMRPIENLTASAERVGSGDLSTRIDTDGMAPELRRLADAFNGMAAKLYEREADLRMANERLTEIASKDSMTGIANRRSFDEQIAGEWRRARRDGVPLAMLAIDVDHFKRFNDCYGHLEGDACLKRVASVFAACARRPGDFVARTGGEEFALILPGADLVAAAAVAEALRRDVEALDIRHARSPENRITVSVGVAALPPGRSDKLSTLIGNADAALYQAKRAGRNRVVMDGEQVALAS